MNIRKITYVVKESSISPTTEQAAGIQGEHNPTEIEFSLDAALRTKLANYDSGSHDNIFYRFDIFDSDGCVFRTKPESIFSGSSIETAVSILLDEMYTRFGGKIKVYLIITALNSEGKTDLEFSSPPARLRLSNIPDGNESNADSRESLTTLAEASRQAAERSAEILAEFEDVNPIAFHQDASGHLIVTKADGTTEDLGVVKGATGQCVPNGGTTGQVLKKKSNTDFDTEWANESGGGGAVNSVNGKIGAVVLEGKDVSAVPQLTASELANPVYGKFQTGDIAQCKSGGGSYVAGYFYKYSGPLYMFPPVAIPVQVVPSKTSDLTNDSGYLNDNDALPVGSVEVDVNSVKPWDYEQTYTIPNDITSGSTVYIEFAYPLREFALEITTPEAVVSAATGYFYLNLANNVGGGRFWEPALGQSHASKLCISFTVGRDGIYKISGYKHGLTSDTDYSAGITYNGFARQNTGRLYISNPQPIYEVFFNSGGDISELAGTTIKVRGLKW